MAQAVGKQLWTAEQSLAATVRGFLRSIRNKHERKLGGKEKIPIGVCVSGGPDSMALAYLLKQVSKADEIGTKPVAFIVNHNARKESSEEAKYVGSLLQKLGIENEILEMHWPNSSEPSSLSDFEMQARRARYRLIANAAIRRQIGHLFLGHHQDDQIETILMRLIRNSSDSFLGRQGIPEHSTIPCCEDIRGAQTAKEYIPFEAWLRGAGVHRAGTNMPVDPPDISRENIITPSMSGIQIHRPLLAFLKSDIVQLCVANDIPYVLDKTNFDPTLTLRNAIRHLRSTYTLPRALQGPSILELHRAAQNCATSLAARGESILQTVKVHTFDLRSGRMTICLSPYFQVSCEEDPEAGAYALARLTSALSPQSKDEDEPTLVPQRNLMDFLEKCKHGTVEQMTMQQVLCEKAESDRAIERATESTVENSTDEFEPHFRLSDQRSTIWAFSRPPMRRRELELASMAFEPSLGRKVVGGESFIENETQHLAKKIEKEGLWSKWLFWDHRYWIRARTQNAERLSTIRIRTYTESDSPEVHKKLGSERDDFQAMLAKAAPGKSRYTVPVLTVDGHVSVFPTFNVTLQKPNQSHPRPRLSHPILEWQVCYKTLDHSFIKDQIETIEWRNAHVEPLS